MRRNSVVSLLILGYTVAPLLSVALAVLIAYLLGCTVNEAGNQPCSCLGIDVSGPLTSLFVMGWFGLITLPTGILALVGFLVLTVWRGLRG